MSFIRNVLALIGLLTIVLVGIAALYLSGMKQPISAMDPEAATLYRGMAARLLATGNAAEATVWKVKVADGIGPEDVEQTMRIVANEHNIKSVGELPLSEQVSLETGKPQRFLKIYQYCNPQTALRMVDFNDAYSAYLPCRIALLEDKEGGLWLYSLNMDLMIHGGHTLPAALKEEAVGVKEIILDIMNRGASGDW